MDENTIDRWHGSKLDGSTDKLPRQLRRPGTFTGYDGNGYNVGDRVELHPATDLWMRGARYGTVVGSSLTPNDRVKVKLDKLPGRTFAGSEDTFRRV